MGIKTTVLLASALVLSTNLNAAIIDNGIYTTDTVSGLDWLDLTETTSRSYNYISTQFGLGGEFEGWRYATGNEVSGFFDAFGGDSNYYDYSYSTQNNGLFDAVAPLWGDLYCAETGCSVGEGFSYARIADSDRSGFHFLTFLNDSINTTWSVDRDFVNIHDLIYGDVGADLRVGNALVRSAAVVPVPAAVWLFGSGILGLFGVAKRNKRA